MLDKFQNINIISYCLKSIVAYFKIYFIEKLLNEKKKLVIKCMGFLNFGQICSPQFSNAAI